MASCPACGKVNLANSRFCISCGKALPRDDTTTCPSCRKPNKAHHVFCISCGARLSTGVSEWKETDLRVTATPQHQWKTDPDIVFCPACNYGCQKVWGECPMCATRLDAPGTVPMFVDKGSNVPLITPASPEARAKVLAELQAVVDAMSVVAMVELAIKTGLDKQLVSTITRNLIAEGLVAGTLDDHAGEFISELPTAVPGMFAPDAGRPASHDARSDIPSPVHGQSAGIDDMVKDMVQSLEMKRGFDFEGGRIHYKLAVRNTSKLVVHDVKVFLDVPDTFKMDSQEMHHSLPVLTPGESRGLDFFLEPKQCGTAQLAATVLFKDIYGKQHAKLVPPLEIQVKTPVVTASRSSFEHVKGLTSRMASDMKMFAIKDLDGELLFDAAFRAVSKFDMSCVHDEKTVKALEAWFSARSKVDNAPVVSRVIVDTTENVLEIRVWSNEDKQITGFLAKIITNLRDEIELIRHVKQEDKKQTIALMRLVRNMEVLKNLAGLRWEAGELLVHVRDIKELLATTLPAIVTSEGAAIASWQARLGEIEPGKHVPDETGDELYDAVDRWASLVDRAMHG